MMRPGVNRRGPEAGTQDPHPSGGPRAGRHTTTAQMTQLLHSSNPLVSRGGLAAVDGEGLADDVGAESANRPGAAGGGGGHGGQEADSTWAGGWYLFPGGAVPVQD